MLTILQTSNQKTITQGNIFSSIKPYGQHTEEALATMAKLACQHLPIPEIGIWQFRPALPQEENFQQGYWFSAKDEILLSQSPIPSSHPSPEQHYLNSEHWGTLLDSYTPFPKNVGLCTTSICNRRCIMCHYHTCAPKSQGQHGSFADTPFIAMSTVQSIHEQCQQMPVRPSIYITALGEHFLHPDASEILKIFKQDDFYLSLITNGSASKKQLLQAAKIGVNEVTFSVHALNKDEYLRIFKTDYFDKLIQKIIFYNDNKSENCICSANYLIFSPQQFNPTRITSFFSKYVDRVYAFQRHHQKLYKTTINPRPTKKFCIAPFSGIYITADNHYSPCCGINETLAFKNLRWLLPVKKFSIIEAFKTYKKMYQNPESPFRQECKNCDLWLYEHISKKHSTNNVTSSPASIVFNIPKKLKSGS